MTTVEDALVGVSRLAIDTAPVIYFIEAHPRYDAVVSRVFQLIANFFCVAPASKLCR